MRAAEQIGLVKHRISTDVALRDIVNISFEAGIGLIILSRLFTVAGAVLALHF